MANFTFLFFKEQILNSKNILLLTHNDPDGDAVGSLLAVKKIIEKNWGKKCHFFLSGKMNINYRLKDDDRPLSLEELEENFFDLIIVLDTNNISRTGVTDIKRKFEKSKILIIDHHVKRGKDLSLPNVSHLINSKATATCEIIFDLIKELKEEISGEIASLLLLGIYTDSGGFFHSNTKPSLIIKVKELLSKGVVFKNILRDSYKGKSVSTLKLLGKKISEAKINSKFGFIYSHIKDSEIKEIGTSKEEISGLVNILNMCKDARFSLLLVESGDGRIKGSLRSSSTKFIDVNIIGRFFGGGGHRLASGFEAFGKIVETDEKIKIN